MDIHTLASDKAFLAQLTTEYEQLKRSGGPASRCLLHTRWFAAKVLTSSICVVYRAC
jgi:hypothetical protein